MYTEIVSTNVLGLKCLKYYIDKRTNQLHANHNKHSATTLISAQSHTSISNDTKA